MKRILTLSLFASLLIGCGGGQPSDRPMSGPATTGATVTEATKIAFLQTCGTKMNGWRALPKATRDANLLAWAKTLPYIASGAVLVASNEPYFQFKDGDACIYEDNGATGAPAPNLGSTFRPAYADQPGKTRAFCVYCFRLGEFEDVTSQIKDELDFKGYSTSRLQNPTVSQILALSGAGVVFWQGHGGLCVDIFNGVKNSRYCLDIGEAATEALSNGAYAHYRNTHEVMLAGREITRSDGTKVVVPEYAISDLFIRNHLKFADNSLVCADSCTGGISTLGQAFLTANAGTYVSWSADSGASSAQRFKQLFDRLLGDNSTAPISHPDERPFDTAATQKWMQTKGYDIDPSSGKAAKLVWYQKSGYRNLMLLPTVARVLYEAPDKSYTKSKYLLEGTFGPDPGPTLRSVTWGSVNCSVLSWDPTYGIRIKLPTPYPSGDIVVTKENRKSNVVPITEWDIPVTYTLTGKGTLSYTVKMTAKIRADVHGERFNPEDPVGFHPVTVYTFADSKGSMSATGLYRLDSSTTVTWSGGTSLRSFDGTYPAGALIFSGYFDIPSKQLKVTVMDDLAYFTQTTTDAGGGSYTNQIRSVIDGFVLGFNIPVDTTTFAIPAGSASPTLPISNQYGVSAKITWGSATPVNPPTPSTAV